MRYSEKWRLPPSHPLRWIEYLPEVGEPILDRLSTIERLEVELAYLKQSLFKDVRKEWSSNQCSAARRIAKLCPATEPFPNELQLIANACSRVIRK